MCQRRVSENESIQKYIGDNRDINDFFIAYLIYSLFFPEWFQTILTIIGLGYIAYILYQIIASKE